MAWLLVGSIPGVLIGSHIGIRVPERGAADRVRLRADPLRDQGLRRPRGDVRDRRRASASARSCCWSGASGGCCSCAADARSARRGRASAGVESPRLGPGRSRPSSSWRCWRRPRARFALTERREARAEPDLRQRPPTASFSPDVQLRHVGRADRLPAAQATTTSPCGSSTTASACARSSRAARTPPARCRSSFDGISDDGDHARRPARTAPVVHLAQRAPHDRAAERDLARHEAADRARAAPDLLAHLARRRRPQGRLPRALPARRAGARDPARRRPAGACSRSARAAGACSSGTARSAAAPCAPGNHVLKVSAQDAAGNRAKPFPFAVVQVRYVSLGRTRVLATPGARFAILVLTDAPQVTWRFNARAAALRGPGRCASRRRGSPASTGSTSRSGGHTAKALVVVA